MAVALPIEFKIAFIVAAGGQRALTDRKGGHHTLDLARVLDPDAPRPSIQLRSEKAHVATKIHVTVTHAGFDQQRRRAVRRILLAEAAEIDLHAGLAQQHIFSAACNLVPANQRQQRLQRAGAGHFGPAKIPGPPQHA